MSRPLGLLRAGFPYYKTLGMRRITNYPADIAFGSEGVIHILCRSENASVVRRWSIDDAERLTDELEGFGSVGEGDGQFVWPVQIVADRHGNIYVSDEALHRISWFSADGEFLGKFGEHGGANGQFDRPSGIAFDSNGNLFVVDTMNHRVQKLTPDGGFVMSFGSFGAGPGQFNMPWGIAVDELDDIYVVDWRNDRVQKFSPAGEFIFEFGRRGSGRGQFKRPTGVAVDLHGDVYVADYGNDRVQLFNQEGQYVQQFLGDASLSRVARTYMMTNAYPNRIREMAPLDIEKLLRGPKSVRVDSEFRMFIADYRSYRVQVYQKEAIPLTEQELAPPLRSPTLQVI